MKLPTATPNTPAEARALVTPSLEDRLIALNRYGHPRIFSHKDGTWSANLDLFISTQGVTAKVESDFTHKTPGAAIALVIERLRETLKTLGAPCDVL